MLRHRTVFKKRYKRHVSVWYFECDSPMDKSKNSFNCSGVEILYILKNKTRFKATLTESLKYFDELHSSSVESLLYFLCKDRTLMLEKEKVHF